MKIAKPITAAVLAALMLSACAEQTRFGGAPDLTMLPGGALPAPELSDLEPSSRPYRVGPFDKLTIDVFGSEELSGKEVQVDASGRMTFPLIGTLAVAGMTPGEIGAAMEARFRGPDRNIHWRLSGESTQRWPTTSSAD